MLGEIYAFGGQAGISKNYTVHCVMPECTKAPWAKTRPMLVTLLENNSWRNTPDQFHWICPDHYAAITAVFDIERGVSR